MKFIKMQALGNDFVHVDCFASDVGRIDDPSALALCLCDRHTGVGADGLILMYPSDAADVRMEIYNADGSRAKMCGNGIRCVAKYAVEQGLAVGPTLRIDTDAGVKSARCHRVNGIVRSVRVDVGPPSRVGSALKPVKPDVGPVSQPVKSDVGPVCRAGTGRPVFRPVRMTPATPTRGKTDLTRADWMIDHPLRIAGLDCRVTCVSIGNPHAVVFVDDLEAVAVDVLGPRFEHAPEFGERINAHFARVDSPTHVTMRTFERGSGATRACGTGACAVCVAGALTKRTGRTITASLEGGDLHIEWADNDHVYMAGPAVEVFTGHWPG